MDPLICDQFHIYDLQNLEKISTIIFSIIAFNYYLITYQIGSKIVNYMICGNPNEEKWKTRKAINWTT